MELQGFVCKPINRPYLELAVRLSEMSVEKLRGVAEGLLEITLYRQQLKGAFIHASIDGEHDAGDIGCCWGK